MRFATNWGNAYSRASNQNRHRFNRTVIRRIEVGDGKIAAVGSKPPFKLLFSMPVFNYGGHAVKTMSYSNSADHV